MSSERPAASWLVILCYAGPLGFIPLLLPRTDRATRWHAKNGLLFFGALVLVGVVATFIGVVAPSLSCLYGIAMGVAVVLYVVVVALAVVKALEGQRLYVAGISRYADRL